MSKRKTLLTTAAAAALVGAMSSGAMAFEVVDWTWTSTVDTDITLTLNDPALTGVTQLEKIQGHLGNISAGSTLSNVTGTGPAGNINNSATAVSNNQSITTDTPLLLHDLQIGTGSINTGLEPGADPDWQGFQAGLAALAAAFATPDPLLGLNEHTLIGVATLLAAGNGIINPATITATANASTITVDNNFFNDATAVTNNANYVVDTVGQSTVAQGIFVADLGQLGIANVAASASASGITLDGANDIGNSATAVGNNLNIKVGPVNAFAAP